MAKTFDGPPTLERSGSEHRVGRFTSFLLRFLSPTRGTEGVVKTIEEGLVRGGAPFGKGDGGIRKNPSLMGKSDASECNESWLSNCRVQLALSTRKDGMICMQSHFDNHVM